MLPSHTTMAPVELAGVEGATTTLEGVLCENISQEAANVTLDYSLAPLQVVVAGSLCYFLVVPLVLFHVRCFPLGSTMAVLLGAGAMVATGVVSQEEAYEVMGRREHLSAILLLLGMLMLAQYVEREQILVRLLRVLLKQHHSFANYIWRVCALSFILSALFTNDACCAILTPLVLKFWESQERPRTELDSVLLAIATSSNLGSVVSVVGSPVMVLLATYTHQPGFESSRLDQLTCFKYLLAPALLGLLLNVGFLVAVQHLRAWRGRERPAKLISEPSQSEQEMAGMMKGGGDSPGHSNGFVKDGLKPVSKVSQDHTYEGVPSFSQDRLACPTSLETIKEDEELEITETRGIGSGIDIEAQERELRLSDSDSDTDSEESESRRGTAEDLNRIDLAHVDYKPSQLSASQLGSLQEQHVVTKISSNSSLSRALEENGLQLSHRLGVYKSVSAASASEFLPLDTGLNQLSPAGSSYSLFQPSDCLPFQVILLLLVVLVPALFLAASFNVKVDLGVAALGVSVLAVAADALLTKRSGALLVRRLDWSVVVLFLGLFVWLHGFLQTGVPAALWGPRGLALAAADFTQARDIALLSAVLLPAAPLLGAAPAAVLLLGAGLRACAAQRRLVLLAAWLVSGAGANLTLYSSAATMAAVHKGVQALNYRLTFWQHLQFCFPTTIIITTVGLLLMYTLLLIPT